MALTRKLLSALGIEAEKIDEIITAHTDTVNGLKAEIAEAKENAGDNEKLKTENAKLKKELQEAQTADKSDAYKVKYEAIKEEYEEYKSNIEAEKTAKTKKEAYRSFLKEIGISEKRLDSVMRVSDLSGITVGEDGKVVDTDNKLSDSLKKEWEDFIVTEGERGADVAKPPKGKDNSDSDTTAAEQRVAKYYAQKYGNKIESKEE